jgi:hypothetical protein
MGQFEQDWLEPGRRVACRLHYKHPRNLRLLQEAEAEHSEDATADYRVLDRPVTSDSAKVPVCGCICPPTA